MLPEGCSKVSREFDCVECGRHIVSFGAEVTDIALCALCIFVPGWYRYPELCEKFDPDNKRKIEER